MIRSALILLAILGLHAWIWLPIHAALTHLP
jgi:hypothetical protein